MACTVLVVMGGAVLAGAMCAVCGCLSAACGVLSRMRTRRPARAQQGVRVQQRERGGHPITAQSGWRSRSSGERDDNGVLQDRLQDGVHAAKRCTEGRC